MTASVSIAVAPGFSRPVMFDVMCMTWLKRSITMHSSTVTVPYRAVRPTSFRPRSTSITCSARSFWSARSSVGERGVLLGVLPRGRVPAMGRTVILPPSTRTITSGEEPIRLTPLILR